MNWLGILYCVLAVILGCCIVYIALLRVEISEQKEISETYFKGLNRRKNEITKEKTRKKKLIEDIQKLLRTYNQPTDKDSQ